VPKVDALICPSAANAMSLSVTRLNRSASASSSLKPSVSVPSSSGRSMPTAMGTATTRKDTRGLRPEAGRFLSRQGALNFRARSDLAKSRIHIAGQSEHLAAPVGHHQERRAELLLIVQRNWPHRGRIRIRGAGFQLRQVRHQSRHDR
jgi:hypothetical protein